MKYEDLKERLQPELPTIDLDQLYAAFRSEGGRDLDRFIVCLREQGLIDDWTFRELHATEEVEVTHDTLLPPTRPGLENRIVEAPTVLRERGRHSSYQLISVLGEGGMGTVWLAKDLDLRRKVALKELKGEESVRRDVIERFINEAQITAQLDHPNIVSVYNLEVRPDGSLAYSMKLVQGSTFKDLIAECRKRYENRTPLDEALTLETRLEHFIKVCDAIAYAHSKGTIHRDLKPGNIMVGRYNAVYVMDWGIAKLIEAERHPEQTGTELIEVGGGGDGVGPPAVEPTAVGQALGTPRFMSPEQASGFNTDLDGRSDQYTLGVILYELVCLKPAVAGASMRETMLNVIKGKLNPIEHAVPPNAVPRELAAIIGRATQLRRDHRYPSLLALRDDVRRFLRGEEVLASPDTLWQKVPRWIGAHRKAAVLLIAAAVLAGVASAGWALMQQRGALGRGLERDASLGRALARVDGRAAAIAAEVARAERLLERLAAMAAIAMSDGRPSQRAVYLAGELRRGGRAPADLAPSAIYRKAVSLSHPVFSLATGSDRVSALPQVRQLAVVGPRLRALLLDSRAAPRSTADEAAVDALLRHQGVPLAQAFIGLPSGVGCVFPGHDATAVGYDPRREPWYQRAAVEAGIYWTAPRPVGTEGELRIVAALALRDARARLQGVAAVELRLAALVSAGLDASPGVVEAALLDGEGRVLRRHPQGEAWVGERPVYELADVRAAVLKGGPDSLRTAHRGRPCLAILRVVPRLGATLVVLLDEAGLDREGD